MNSDIRTTRSAALSKAPTMRVVSRMLLVLPALVVIYLGVLSAQFTSLWAAPAMQSDSAAPAVLTLDNSDSLLEVMQIDAKGVTQALFFPDGESLALAMPEGVVIYDVATWTPQRTIATGASRRIAISANGEILGTMAGNEAQLWRVSDGTLLQTLSGHGNTIEDIAFSPDDTPDNMMVATAGLGRSARIWRVSDGQSLYDLRHLGRVYSAAFRFDGLVLATGSDAGTTLWDANSGSRIRIADITFAAVNQIAFSPDGLTLALAMHSGIVKLYNGTNYTSSKETPRGLAVNTLAFTPNGQLLAYGGSDESVHVMGVEGNEALVTLTGHHGAINSVAFSPDGRLLVSTSADGTLRVWTSKEEPLPTGTPVPTATPIPTVAPTLMATPAPRNRVVVGAPVSPLPTPTVISNNDSEQPASNEAGTPSAVGTEMPVSIPTQGLSVQSGASQSETVEDDADSLLPVVIIEPELLFVSLTDWQRVMQMNGPGANVSLCEENLLWLSSNQQVWFFDGQAWHQELAGKVATVACDPDGVPYALVTSSSAEENRIVSTLYRRQDDQWKEVGMASFYAGVGQTWFDWSVDRDGSIWVPTILDDGAEGGIIHGVVHFDDGMWSLYVGENENRLDDPNSMPGALVKEMTIHKTIPAEFAGPSTLPPDALRAPISFWPDIDLGKDGRVWLKRPGLWPLVLDGRRWQPGVDFDLFAQLTSTLSSDTSGVGLQEALHMYPELVTGNVLNAQDAPWIAVAGGVLHKQNGQWKLYILPAQLSYPRTLIPLAVGTDGAVWFWNETGVLRFNGETWQHFTGEFMFDVQATWPQAIWDATVGADGALWMGGLRLLKGGAPISIPNEASPDTE